MISSISLPQRVPFDREQVTIDGLGRVCFLFGPNGSGKTTISQLIADEAENSSSNVINWDSVTPIKTYVYNRRFISKNFSNENAVPGVFTMGEDAVNAQDRIAQLTSDIEKEQGRRDNAQGNLDQAVQELSGINDAIRDACWTVRTELSDAIKHIWTGTGRKEPFRDDLLKRIGTLTESDVQPDIADLERRIGIVFDNSVVAVSPIPQVDFTELTGLENEPILGKKIVGKEDLPIGALIKKLGNSDWVAQGRAYATEGDICPFCQQHTITDKLRAELDEFFDETYETDKAELRRVSSQYATRADSIINALKRIVESYPTFVDVDAMKTRLAQLESNVRVNRALFEKKIAEPSIPIVLDSAVELCAAIATLLDGATDAVSRHNEMIAHRSEEKRQIINELWLYAAMVAKPRISGYSDSKSITEKKIAGLRKKIDEHDDSVRRLRTDLESAERSLTNVKETADAINALLARFGFTNFHLAVTDDNKYRIERMDGSLVNDTLSEGETSFLTFLYFYYLMNGSQETTGTTDKRIVVIDDPVSSMDADVLFVASSLVRQLAKEARGGSGTTMQLIVLTHNITFHHEVTYIRAGEGDPQTSYFVIHKNDGHSTVEKCPANPICSTYELLWKDICRDDCNPLTAQNVARRITETFFKLVGGPDLDETIAGMSSPDREIARSYVSWANAGSHSPFDDETYFNTRESIEVYRRVLKTIFEEAGYASHYEEMTSRFIGATP